MQHSYLYRPGRWSAQGTYWDNQGKDYPLSGEMELLRTAQSRTLTGFMAVAFPESLRVESSYVIVETAEASTFTWESNDPDLGTLRGTFSLLGECVLSFYQSTDGRHAGTETLIRRDENRYDSVGAVYSEGEKLSAWTADLVGTFFEEEVK